jgi:hypothetical protein
VGMVDGFDDCDLLDLCRVRSPAPSVDWFATKYCVTDVNSC